MTEQFITPQMYGAKGDGITDDTAAIQSALNSGSKTILIPDGMYIVSGTLTVPDGVYVLGVGTLRRTDIRFNNLIEPGNNSTLQVIIDNGQESEETCENQCSNDIYINGKKNVHLIRCRILNSSARYNICVDNSHDITISECHVERYLEHGIGLRGGCRNIKIIGNTVLYGHGTSSNRYAIVLNSNTKTQAVNSGILCESNYIEDENPKWEGIDAHDLTDSVIRGNIIRNTLTGIAISASGTPTEHLIISDNLYVMDRMEIDTTGYCYGIALTVASGSKWINVTNNILTGCGQNTNNEDRGGIRIYGADDVTISGNKISTVHGRGIYVWNAGNYPIGSLRIHDNDICGSNDAVGIMFYNRNNRMKCNVYDNSIYDCTYGIDFDMTWPNGNYLGYCYIRDNSFTNCAKGDYNGEVDRPGCILSPSTSSGRSQGRTGMNIQQSNLNSGYMMSICTKSGTEAKPAEWTVLPTFFTISGKYKVEKGYALIQDSRITPFGSAAVTCESSGIQASAVVQAGKIHVQLCDFNGKRPSGTYKLNILFMGRP